MILAGDTQQLQAVENGGGMSLLADALGYARLAEPVRFRNRWEQAASLRLRDGDTTVLAEYDQHARINGGDPEQMMDAAAAAYVALTTRRHRHPADGRRPRAAPRARPAASATTSSPWASSSTAPRSPSPTAPRPARGDLIICTRNDHTVEAGEPGRTLANGDLLRIEAVTPRRADRAPRPGRRPGAPGSGAGPTATSVYAGYQ